MSTEVSEEHISSILRVKKKAKQAEMPFTMKSILLPIAWNSKLLNIL
jgi:hypothetical protein